MGAAIQSWQRLRKKTHAVIVVDGPPREIRSACGVWPWRDWGKEDKTLPKCQNCERELQKLGLKP
jgi:hypothetical protein